MKLHPEIAKIIQAKVSGGGTRLEATCPFCQKQLRVEIPLSISCPNCTYLFSVYPFEEKLARQAEQLKQLASGTLPTAPIKVEENHAAFDTLKFILSKYVSGTSKKLLWRIQVIQNYALNRSHLASFKGKPFTMDFETLLPLDFSNIPAMTEKIGMYVFYR